MTCSGPLACVLIRDPKLPPPRNFSNTGSLQMLRTWAGRLDVSTVNFEPKDQHEW